MQSVSATIIDGDSLGDQDLPQAVLAPSAKAWVASGAGNSGRHAYPNVKA
jgi:hypothetical protein